MLKNFLNQFISNNKTYINDKVSTFVLSKGIYYNSILVCVKVFNFFLNRIQKFISNTYVILLQTNRLPFRVLPSIIKNMFIILSSKEAWNNLFGRLNSHQNIIISRVSKYYLIHTFWAIFFTNKTHCLNELNVKRQYEKKISNYYYNIRVHNVKNSKRTYNFILHYYLNKTIFSRYFYFYWQSYTIYTNFNSSEKSVHLRSHIFFIIFNSLNSYLTTNSVESCQKIDASSFKGIHNYFMLLKAKKLVFSKKQTNIKDNLLTPTIKKITNNIIKQKYIFRNKKNLILPLNPVFKNLKLIWFNKVHNSIEVCKKNTSIFYIRVSKHFNKGRYSRNRQLYRTGVYWCIWLNVVIVYALHYYFYRVVFAFGYLWLPLCIMMLSVFGSRIYKYRYYSWNQIRLEFKAYFTFLFLMFVKTRLYILNKFNEVGNTIKEFITTYFYVLKKQIELLFKK